MVTCFMVATIISALSIFAFYGNAFANTGGTAIPNMFQLMFGGSGNYSGYIIVWKQYGGLTFLFALEIIIISMAFITWYVCATAYEDIWKIGCAIFSGISRARRAINCGSVRQVFNSARREADVSP